MPSSAGAMDINAMPQACLRVWNRETQNQTKPLRPNGNHIQCDVMMLDDAANTMSVTL